MDPDQAIAELAEQLRPLLDESPDGVYLWLDESHKVCNARKDGTTVAAETDMIPITHREHVVAFHFVRAVGD